MAEKLVIGGEFFHQTATVIGGKDSTEFSIGAIAISTNTTICSRRSAMQNASKTNQFSWYIAHQIGH